MSIESYQRTRSISFALKMHSECIPHSLLWWPVSELSTPKRIEVEATFHAAFASSIKAKAGRSLVIQLKRMILNSRRASHLIVGNNIDPSQKKASKIQLICTIAGIIVGITGLFYGNYQKNEIEKLKNHNRAQAWYLYARANTVGSQIQKAYSIYKTNHKDNLNLETVEILSKVAAFSEGLFSETVRQIQLSEPKFDLPTIEQWMQSGKISQEGHKQLFTQIMIEDKKEEKQ